MRAVVAQGSGGPEVLRVVDVDAPVPGPADLLVHVRATAVNRADVLQRRGMYPPPPGTTDVLGLEVAGEVAGVGADAAGWREGDAVFAILPGGGYAEYAVVPATVAMPVPGNLDWPGAAAVPEAFLTALDNLRNRGRLADGETVLLHGGSSGVGTAAIQLARAWSCRVLVTASSRRKLDACAELGADAGIDYGRDDFVERAVELTGGRGVDVILDIVGGPYLDRNVRALAPDGRLVVIGLMGGASAELDLARLLTRRLSVSASTLRARGVDAKAALADQARREVSPLLAAGTVRPVVDRVLGLDDVADAHALMESSEHIGKIVLTV
ncbi:NAD(P)H-quinone oxidoreductase [soil metagenome]